MWRSTDPRRIRLFLSIVVLTLGAIRAWSSRHAANPAGIAYLDIADAYMRGDFANAINAYWSPLYSLLLGPVLALVRPEPSHEASVVHAVNFLVYAVALWAFDGFLRALIDRASDAGQHAIPEWSWIVFGYAVFTWSSLVMIGVADMSADLLMAVCVYGAAAVVVRMQGASPSPVRGAALGAWLGLGYLAKAAMCPLAFVFLACALFSRSQWRRNISAVVAALLIFALVVAPFVVALSRQKGRATTGDVGRLAYAWFVSGVTMYAHWQGGPPGHGTPIHPSRKIHDDPEVFEYATPIAGTHPVFYDPSYWYEGLTTRVDARKQIWALLVAGKTYWSLLLESQAEWFVLAVLVIWGGRRRAASLVVQQWFLLVPAVAAFGMFAIVHTEPRFVGAFAVMLMSALLLAVRIPDDVASRRIAATLIAGVALVVMARVTVSTAQDALARRLHSPSRDADISRGLQTLGVRAADRIGMIGLAYDAYWARLARLRFVAEMPPPDALEFWTHAPARRASVYDAFRRAGARWIITESLSPTMEAEGWQPVGATGVYVHSLDVPP